MLECNQGSRTSDLSSRRDGGRLRNDGKSAASVASSISTRKPALNTSYEKANVVMLRTSNATMNHVGN
jgi:hypothetical protein